MDSIDELYTENYSYDGSIDTNYLEDIWEEIQIRPEINARDARFKISYCMR